MPPKLSRPRQENTQPCAPGRAPQIQMIDHDCRRWRRQQHRARLRRRPGHGGIGGVSTRQNQNRHPGAQGGQGMAGCGPAIQRMAEGHAGAERPCLGDQREPPRRPQPGAGAGWGEQQRWRGARPGHQYRRRAPRIGHEDGRLAIRDSHLRLTLPMQHA